MSIHPVKGNWLQAPSGGERIWIGLALVWCLVMTLMMPYWHFRGKQNSTGEAYRVNPVDFANRVKQFVTANKVGTDAETGLPIVEPAPGGDAYLQAKMWDFYPILKLKKGKEYRLHLSSLDVQHGFSLQPMNINFQINPTYDHVVTLTPTREGPYQIICNEFCGIGHHRMTGRIIVE